MDIKEIDQSGELPFFVMTMRLSYGEIKKVLECYLTDIRWGDIPNGNGNCEVKSL
jgi:hypothetical protein